MTLREFGQSVVDYWNAYVTEITTQHVLDWSIGNLLMTVIGGFIGAVVGFTILVGALTITWLWLSKAWEKTGLPYTMDRLDKRFGPFFTGVIMIAVTIGFVIGFGVVAALLEMAQR